MESSINKKQTEEQRQADIRRQIALLQAQLQGGADPDSPSCPTTPKKRKNEGQTVLAVATPSPKKKKVAHDKSTRFASSSKHTGVATSRFKASAASSHTRDTSSNKSIIPIASKPAPSAVITKLASLSSSSRGTPQVVVQRSAGFTDKVSVQPVQDEDGASDSKRDHDLTVLEDLTPGPYEHNAPFDDPHFERLEPHSGIRLSSRTMPHENFQDYLRGRYYLSPSKLYSVVRLSPNKQGYDVPVEGDWVTIAVVAERGPVKYSRAPVTVGHDEKPNLSEEEDDVKDLKLDAPPKPPNPYQNANRWKGKGKAGEEPPKPSGKKYMSLKLVDFGCRSSSSASGGKSLIRGDAFLTLLLFESDRVDVLERDDGVKEKKYKGGSRGAFEKLAKLKEGAVVAFLNPKILKPFQRTGQTPNPIDNILAISPESADAIAVLGHSQDLGMCSVVRRDGKPCGSWCDKRVSDVCDYHVQTAVQRKRAGRAEFTQGTSGMSSSASKRKTEYDPARQWGLKPEEREGTGSTYILSGHVVSNGPNSNSLFVSERMGRDAQAKAARVVSKKETDRALAQLLKRDKGGMRAVKAARDYGRKMGGAADADAGGKGEKRAVDKKAKQKQKQLSDQDSDTAENEPVKNAYSANLIKALGFDPTAKDGHRVKDADVEKKLKTLASLQASRNRIELGPRPGKLKSTVYAPSKPEEAITTAIAAAHRPVRKSMSDDDDTSDSDSELVIPSSDEEPTALAREARASGQMRPAQAGEPRVIASERNGPGSDMVDLDSSDVE